MRLVFMSLVLCLSISSVHAQNLNCTSNEINRALNVIEQMDRCIDHAQKITVRNKRSLDKRLRNAVRRKQYQIKLAENALQRCQNIQCDQEENIQDRITLIFRRIGYLQKKYDRAIERNNIIGRKISNSCIRKADNAKRFLNSCLGE